MLELMKLGGWVMWPILACAVLTLAISLERFWTLRRKNVLPPELGREVREWAASGKLDPAHLEVLRQNSPLGELLSAALEVRDRPREQIKERVEDVGRHVAHDLDRFLTTLGSIASVSPLLGLLGTVFGMIRMFFGILETGVGDANRLAGGIGEALITTAAGLCVAIPSLMLYRHFRALVVAYTIDMEKQSIALLDTLETGSPKAPAARARRASK